MGFPGLQYLHPFDSYRARRVRQELARHLGFKLHHRDQELPGISLRSPKAAVLDSQLEIVHSLEYLQSLKNSWVIAQAIEVPPFALTPRAFLDWSIVTPMRWAVSGTLLAAREALRTGMAFSLTGGFHHAKPAQGEGFCIFSDIGYCIRTLHQEGAIATVAYVDLDAHQGNGVAMVFENEPQVRLFDVYNGEIYPRDPRARERLDASYPLRSGCQDAEYLNLVEGELPDFLDKQGQVDLLVYNAGNDVVEDDLLGNLALTPDGVLRRDLFVIEQARNRAIPLLFLPSGGYTRHSYHMISRTILSALKRT